jgi:DMSO/TMAO reductase YedYZ molybdopterin-dependent catalytic subunit
VGIGRAVESGVDEFQRPVSIGGDVERTACLALAGAVGAAGFVTIGSGEYTAVLTREQAEDERVLLAPEHEGAASPRRPGLPRLIGPSERDCFVSVKSVDRIEVTRQPQRATAATIAPARLRRQERRNAEPLKNAAASRSSGSSTGRSTRSTLNCWRLSPRRRGGSIRLAPW